MVMPKRFFFSFILSSLIAGCADFYGAQPPAPIYGGHPNSNTQSFPATGQQGKISRNKQDSTETVTTEPLKDYAATPESIEFKPEPLPPEREQKEQPEEPSSLTQTPIQSPAQTPKIEEPESPPLTPFEPLKTSAPLSPAVGALVLAATQNTTNGNLESASATIERAIRIEPRNANLFYKLALIRIKQSKPRLAEDLAKKSALLAANDITLKKHSWLLIAHARELQKNFKGAKEARAKANRL